MAEPFDPFAAGAEPVDEPAAAQAPAAAALPAEAPPFDPFAAGAEPVEAPFDPFAAGAEPAKPEGNYDWAHQLKNALDIGASDVSAGIFNALSGLARGIAIDTHEPKFHFPVPGVGSLMDKVLGPLLGGGEANKAQAAQFYSDAADYWKDKAKQVTSSEYVDPALENTIGAKAAHLIAGTGVILGEAAIPEIGVPLLLTHNSLQRYGEVFNQTGDADKAQNARNISLIGNSLFMGQGHVVAEGLEKVLPEGVNAIAKWAATASAATAGNVATGQLIKAADAANQAPEGKRMEAFTDALKDITIPDAAIQLAFGVHTAITAARATLPEIPAAEKAISNARTVAPRTAEALQTQVDEAIKGATEVKPIAPAESALAPTAEAAPAIAAAETAPVTIAGPALTDAAGNVMAEGTIGATHASLTGEALPKFLDAHPDAEPTSMEHQFRGSDGSVIPRDKAWEIAKAAGQIKPDVVAYKEKEAAKNGKPPELHSQDLQGAPFTESPKLPEPTPAREVPPVIPTRPLPETLPPPTPAEVAAVAKLTPEERTAKIETATTDTRTEAAKTGLVPSVVELRGRLANDAKAAAALHTELTADLAAKYPPEPLPAGATETTTKNTLTGDQLPSINEGGKLRPRFSNDPNLTAQQIDNGVVGVDKANRLYVPDEIMDNDQLNPAIETTYDKEAGKFYITKVNSEFGEVSKPGDFETAYRADKAYKKAHQLVLGGTPEEVQQIANRVAPEDNPVGQALIEHGFREDAIPLDLETIEAPPGSIETPKTEKPEVSKNIQLLKSSGLLTGEGTVPADAARGFLQNILKTTFPSFAPGEAPVVAPWMRILARTLLNSKVDLSKVKIKVVNQPKAPYAGLYDGNGTITLNTAHGHESTVIGTAIHEILHHYTVAKTDPSYPRTPVEQKAYEDLNKLFDHAVQEIYKINFGKEGTPEELVGFRIEHAGGKGNRAYYGITNIKEFIAETLSNPRFMKVLDQLPAHPEVKTTGKYQSLLATIRYALKRLFTGMTAPNSTLDQAVEHALRLAETPLNEAPAGNRAEAPPEGKPPVVVDGPGWVSPGGEFIPAEESSAISENTPETGMIGGHEAAAIKYLEKTDLPKAADLTRQLEEATAKGDSGWDLVTKFMEQNGFVRVQGGGRGGTIYITGKPSRSQLQLLKDNAIEQKATLVHDLGATRSRTLFQPGEFSPPAEPSATAPKITATETGHTVDIPPDATREELQASLDSLDTMELKPEDKTRIQSELQDALGPTITLTAPGGPTTPAPPAAVAPAPGGPAPTLTKRQANDRIAYGYDAVNNIANGRGKQIANSVALDFGKSQAPTPEQLQDRAAAPFVVEAGGNKEELVRDLMQVLHSKDPKLAEQYAPVIQHAIDNFDRLNATTQHYREVTKEQLAREHAAGVTTGELDNYVTRLLEQPDSPVLPASGGQGRSAYFTKGRKFEKLADAIKEGYTPKSTDIADLTQRRVEAGERLVQQKLLEQELRTLNTPSGQPILGDMQEYQSTVGKKELTVPRGYQLVQTGGRPLVVNAEVALIFKALYGDSTINQTLKNISGQAKKITLALDTFHVGRILFKELAYSKGAQRVGYNKGLSLLEYTPEDIKRAVAAGDINQTMADYTEQVLPSGLTRRGATEELLKRGLNVGKVSDNLLAEHADSLPFINNFNDWVFKKLSRGAMIQTALENFERNMARFPERGIEGNARQTAKESNEVFGNLQNQGLFTNKNYQDLARALVLAPNWAESQMRAELRGYGQLAKGAGELLTGKARLGTVAQGQLTVILGMLAANQIANYLSTGHSTFQNKEGHKLDAFIPGGTRGFYFSPLEIGAEYAHMASRYFSQHQNPIDVIKQIASNKLGPVGRATTTLISGRDFAGRSFATTKDRIVGALTDLVPIPIGLSGVFERDPRQEALGPGLPGLPGFRRNRQPGSGERQGLQSLGLKLTPAQSPTSEMFALAYPFRSDRSYQGPVEYRDLRSALDNRDPDSVQKELALLSARGKTLNQIQSAIGVGTRQKFTDSTVREVAFIRSLTPEQKQVYEVAQREHADHARDLMKALREAPKEVRTKLRTNLKPELPSK